MYSSLNFDGLWEDMNEASDFCSGSCYNDEKVDSPTEYKLKYTPTGRFLT